MQKPKNSNQKEWCNASGHKEMKEPCKMKPWKPLTDRIYTLRDNYTTYNISGLISVVNTFETII
jgi:mRNA-degrading endonuclease HigB of HigAB toxin-antitoxin module